MNALPGQEAKTNPTLCRTLPGRTTGDGGRKDGDDLRGAVARCDLIRGCECDVLHDGEQELQPS